ncbi:MAG: glycosyltransferase [Clostridiaceae bacterium]|nr:glycosyltransferase [Clostridiaceae bacterium]
MSYEYLLSICMMVRDEEKNLRRCLEAMRSIIQRDDVELIIVDTGSFDSTVEIARDFTDKVYFHKWGDNFSEMRNITISYAKGIYILIMDADEVLTDAELLYKYVSDEKYRSYNAFVLKIKNFSSSGGFTVLPQERIFKNDGTFCYEGAVHNQPKFKKPILNTEIYLDHYGYLFHDSELREKKFKRTAGILMKELEKNPNNAYYRFQLAKSYGAHRDKKEAHAEIIKAYELISGDIRTMQAYIYVYGTYAIICIENNEFDEAVRICREGIELRPEYLDLYYLMAGAYMKSNKPEEALSAYRRYLELVTQYDRLAISADRSVEMYYTDDKCKDTAYTYIFNELYKNREYKRCYEYSTLISDKKSKAIYSVKALLKLRDFDEVKTIYCSCGNNRSICDAVEALIENESESMTEDENKQLWASLGDGDEPYLILNQFRGADGSAREALLAKALKQIDFNSMNEYFADILIDMDKNKSAAISTLKRMKKSKIKQYIRRIYSKNHKLEEFFEQYALYESVRNDDHNGLKVFISIAYVILFIRAGEAKSSGTEITERHYSIFKRYIEKGHYYVNTLYDQERMRLYYKTLEDQEDTFFIALNYAREAFERRDVKVAIKYFKEAAKANIYMAGYMNRYKDEIFKDMTELNDVLNDQDI